MCVFVCLCIGVVCLLLVAVVSVAVGEEEWSWGLESKEGASATPADQPSEVPSHAQAPIAPKSLGVDALPLEPHAPFVGDEEVVKFDREGLQLDEETLEELMAAASAVGSDREARFLGIGEKLCSYGIGINVSFPLHVTSRHFHVSIIHVFLS